MRARIVVVCVALLGCAKQESPGNQPSSGASVVAPEAKKFGELSVDEVEARIKSGNVAIFDANPREVFDKRHLPGATWIPFDEVTANLLPKEKDRPLVFYCFNEK